MTRTLLAAAAVAATLMTSLPAAAQFQKPEDAVKYRKAGMTLIGAHFGRIGAMASGRAPFDAAAANANAEVLTHLVGLPFAGFVDGTAGTDKGAAKSNNLDTVKAAFGNAGSSCKSCHDDFRNQ